MFKVKRKSIPGGQQRLLNYLQTNWDKLTKIAADGMAQGAGGAVTCLFDEETRMVEAAYISDPLAAVIAERSGVYPQFALMSTICAVLPWMVPVLVELHTPNDQLFYAVTQLDTRKLTQTQGTTQ